MKFKTKLKNEKFLFIFLTLSYILYSTGGMLLKSAREVFAENLQNLLEERKIDQSMLAKNIGVSNASVSYWLNGEKYPRIDKIQKIADFFDIPKSHLTEEHPSKIMELNSLAMKVPILGFFPEEQKVEVAQQDLGKKFELLEASNQEIFYLQIQNCSMEPTIPNRSYVLIKKQEKIENGNIVAIRIKSSSEIALMRIRHIDENIQFLVPDNPEYDEIIIKDQHEDVEIIGKAVSYTVEL